MFKNVKNPVLRETLDWGVQIAIAVIIGLIIVNFVVQRTIVDGQSMEPTLQNGDNLWVEKISPKLGKLKRGDIVTINVPEKVGKERNPLIKRVIALENETVEIKEGKVLINGKVLKEDYITGNYTREGESRYSKLTVGKGYVYVMGDNRPSSMDSRYIGPVKVSSITGKALLRFYPFKKFKVL